jgi:hypothetical protein
MGELTQLIEAAVSEPDAVRSNLKITLAHHTLSERLRAVTGED